jgi:hypothetical protein
MHLPIYETVSTLVRDYSPAGQNATCPVTPTGGAPVLACPTVVADSQRGNVLRFNNSALAVNVVNNFPATALTVAYWVKSTDAADVIPHISYATAAHPDTFLFGFIYDPAFLNRSGATTNVSAYSRSALNNGAWRHVAITWQSAGGAFTLYRDGVAVTSGTLAAGTTMGASGILVFGQDQDSLGGGFDFNQVYRGDLDGVSIYDRVLTVQEIRDHMAATRDDSAITAVAVAASSSTALVGETVRFTATTNSPATNVVYTCQRRHCQQDLHGSGHLHSHGKSQQRGQRPEYDHPGECSSSSLHGDGESERRRQREQHAGRHRVRRCVQRQLQYAHHADSRSCYGLKFCGLVWCVQRQRRLCHDDHSTGHCYLPVSSRLSAAMGQRAKYRRHTIPVAGRDRRHGQPCLCGRLLEAPQI